MVQGVRGPRDGDFVTTSHPRQASSAGITVANLRAVFPGWTITEAGGRVWAVRPGRPLVTGPESLIASAVSADSPEGLFGQLGHQEWLETLTPSQLAELWGAVSSGAAA